MSYREDLYKDIQRKKASALKGMDFKTFCVKCFYHPVGDGKRLKQYGSLVLRKVYPIFVVDVVDGLKKQEIPSKHYLFLSKHCQKAYYIGTDKIIFFDQDEAFLFKMCDGDIQNVSEIAGNGDKS